MRPSGTLASLDRGLPLVRPAGTSAPLVPTQTPASLLRQATQPLRNGLQSLANDWSPVIFSSPLCAGVIVQLNQCGSPHPLGLRPAQDPAGYSRQIFGQAELLPLTGVLNVAARWCGINPLKGCPWPGIPNAGMKRNWQREEPGGWRGDRGAGELPELTEYGVPPQSVTHPQT